MDSSNIVLRSLNVGHGENRFMRDCTHYNPPIACLSPLRGAAESPMERTGASLHYIREGIMRQLSVAALIQSISIWLSHHPHSPDPTSLMSFFRGWFFRTTTIKLSNYYCYLIFRTIIVSQKERKFLNERFFSNFNL